MAKRSKKLKKAPKISLEEQLEINQKEAESKWESDQKALKEKSGVEFKEYNQRRVVLVETIKFFRKLEKAAAETHRHHLKQTEWDQFLSCEKLPNPASAAQLREFLYRWSYELEESRKTSTSWTLDVNERSPLTQDETSPLETRKMLKARNEDVGSLYLPGIRTALKILALIDDSTQKHLPQKEVVLVRDEIRQKITDVLNEMTMRVGGNIWRDMTPLDSISSEFAFSSDIVRLYLWSFRHVPLPPEYNYFFKSLSMRSLDVNFLKPSLLDFKDALIRGLWTQFDHFSDLDPTFRCAYLEPVPDLIASQEIEWADRNVLKMQKLHEMRLNREKFEADKKQKELEELENAKTVGSKKELGKPGPKKKAVKKKKKDKVVSPVLEVAPPLVTVETIVDIDAEYVQHERQQYDQKMEQIGPNSLCLSKDYVNLRKFRIIGGIYSINRFCKLPQPSELRCDFIYTSSPSGIKLTEKPFKSETEEQLIQVKIKLPDYCFWWEEPVVCSWEIWEESKEFESLEKDLQEFHINYEKTIEEKSKLLFCASKPAKHTGKPTIIPDFNINDIPTDIKLHFLIIEHILPRLPQNFKFYAELHKLFEIMLHQFESDQRIKIEEMLNELLYPKFLAFQASNANKTELFRIPSLTDIPDGKESMASMDGPLVSPKIETPIVSMLQELAIAQKAPSYLFPPGRTIPLLVITEKKGLEPCELEIDEIIQELHDSATSDDAFSAESVYKLFSTFLKLLDRLREKEQPEFVDVIDPEEQESDVDTSSHSRTESKRLSHHHRLSVGGRERRPSRKRSSFLVAARLRQLSQGSVLGLKKKKKRRKSKTFTTSDASTDEEHESKGEEIQPAELQLLPHPPGRWTTKLVHRKEFEPTGKVITMWVEQLGSFGFAMEKYYNLPFKGWEMRRTGKVSDFTSTVTLDCTGMQVTISVSKVGYRIEFQNAPQNIKPPADILTLEDLEKYLTKVNLTIFPEPDTPQYVRNMTTPKHESMEVHNLKCLAAFCLTHNFTHCFWNKFASAREALIQSRQLIEGRQESDFVTVMMSPLKAATVSVEELCSPLDQVLLEYQPVPENQAYNPDVYHLLKDTLEEPSRKLLLKTPPLLQWNVSQLLLKLRLFSFS